MVTEENLQALDYLIWLGNGRQAAEATGTHQSTISRRVNLVLSAFQLSMKRHQGRVLLHGLHRDLLTLERQVHQGRRLLGRQGLRLEVEAEAWPWIQSLSLPDWQLAHGDHLDRDGRIALLLDRAIDAWIGALPAGSPEAAGAGRRSELLCLPLPTDGAGRDLALMVRAEHGDHRRFHDLVAALSPGSVT